MKKKIAIYNPYLETRGGGEKVCLAMAEYLSKENDVILISRTDSDLEQLGKYFSLDLSRCKHLTIKSESLLIKISRKLRLPHRLNAIIHENVDYRTLKKQSYDVFVNNCYKSTLPSPAQVGIYMCMFPQVFNHKKDSVIKKTYHRVMDGIEYLLYGKSGIDIIKGYDKITVNSQYTKSWVEKLWDVPSEKISILYPICENMDQGVDGKEKLILSVGRFFANSGENHYKCQDKLLETFLEMKDLHKDGWRLCFVGSSAEDANSLKYLVSLYQQSRDNPVEVISDAPFSVLKDLYGKASLYWHATGWGSDPSAHPEKQEHFGITTVEAMSAGAVPVVINTAGQKETVEHNVSGFLWDTKKQLVDYTRELTSKKTIMNNMRETAINSSKKYNKDAFENSLDILF